jgi:hypothetical protein
MYDSKAMALYRTLTAAEQRRFKKWIASPAHNANKTLAAFYEFVASRSELTPRTLHRERAYAAVFPGRAYDDLALRRLMSEFIAVLEDFLAAEARREEPAARHLALARVFHDRQRPAEARAHLDAAGAALPAPVTRSAGHYLEAYRIEEERLRQTPRRATALNVQEMSTALAHFFAAETLHMACTAASHQAVYRADYHIAYLDAVLADCDAGRYADAPGVMLYFHCYRCLHDPAAVQHFQALRALLPAAAHWLEREALRGVVLQAINYGIRRLNTDEPAYLRDVFELYRLGLGQGVFLENGTLGPFTFKNIAAAAIKLGELDWVEDFIRTYAPLVPEPQREPVRQFCEARLCYERRDYARAQSLLHGLSADDVFLNLDGRVLLLKIYYENGEWRLLQAFLRTFERFVRRQKKLAYHAPNYLNIIHLTQRLLHERLGAPPSDELRRQILTAQPLTQRAWLLRMAGQ